MVTENVSNPLYLQNSLSPDILNLKHSNGLDVESYRSTSSFQPASPLDALNLNLSSSPPASSQLSFTSGVFTVGSTGQVGIDYLFDGGGFQGELAIFSLDGLELLGLGTPEFIHEIARRALSNSTSGYVLISDQTEGARFSSALLWEGDFNTGDYLGTKTVTMRPGDTFGVAIVPNGTFQQVLDKLACGDDQLPLFSFNTANPNGAVQAGLIGDVTGKGHTFAFEDLRLDGESDRDYNDIVFQVRGAIGQAGSLDELIDPNRDWRTSAIGQALLTYAAPYDAPQTTQTVDYNFPQSSQLLIGIIDTGFSANNPDIDYSDLLLGSDRIGNDNNPLLAPGEGNEHGTHILGIIGATQNNGIGIDGINDKAPVWLGRTIGSGQWEDTLAEFVTAHIASNQPNAVVNLSLDLTQKNPDGSITTRYELTPAEREAIEFARQHNVVLVVAAGNDGGVMSALGQASQEFDNIITVGAADGLNRANYSSYGDGLDILAPGGTTENGILSTVGDGVGTLAGTSVATAQVTGAISQVWAANPALSYRQVIEIVKLTATDLNTPDWDAETGTGLLNLAAAVAVAKITQPQVHEAPASLIPATWTGEGTIIPFERAVGSFNYPIRNESFSGRVGPNIGVNLRYSPWFDDRSPRNEPLGKTLSFDAWTYGERGTDLWYATPDELWYRVTGTNYWVPSAYIAGYPGSRPPVLAPAQPNPNPNPNPNQNPNPNPTPIVPINANSANYRNGQLNPYAYNSALIGQCTWYAYGRMVETGSLPANAKSRSLFLGNAANWERDARNAGLPVSNTPVQGSRGLVVFPPGVRGGDARFGHVAFLEEVYPDGRIRISESNWNGIKQPRERILTPAQYGGVKFVQLENARLNPSTSAPSAIPGRNQQYIIKSGDTLSAIAQRYLGNANRWREIKKSDGSTFTDAETRQLQIGSSVYLPVNHQPNVSIPAPTITLPPSPVPQPVSDSDGSLSSAKYLGTFDDRQDRHTPIGSNLNIYDSVGHNGDQNDFLKFHLDVRSNLNLSLSGLGADADLRLIRDLNGNQQIDSDDFVAVSGRPGNTADSVSRILEPGDYYVQVLPGVPGAETNYNLSFSQVGLSDIVRPNSEPVNIWRYDSNGRADQGIEPGKETVVVIHGWQSDDNENGKNIRELAKEASEFAVQVLSLDWSSIARKGLDWTVSVPYETASWITPVAEWAHQRLTELGILSNQLTFVGHSLGTYVSSAIANLFGRVKNLVALDPAFPADGDNGYDIDINTPGKQNPKNFRDVADNSLAFVVADGANRAGLAGDNDKAATAQNSFIMQFDPGQRFALTASDTHGAVVDAFTNALDRRDITLPNLTLPNLEENWYDNNGDKDNWLDRRFNPGKHEGTVSAVWTGNRLNWDDGQNPWLITGLTRVVDDSGTEQTDWT